MTSNQFLIIDENHNLIHTGPIGMCEKIADRVNEIIPLERLAYVAFCILKVMNGEEWIFSKHPKRDYYAVN